MLPPATNTQIDRMASTGSAPWPRPHSMQPSMPPMMPPSTHCPAQCLRQVAPPVLPSRREVTIHRTTDGIGQARRPRDVSHHGRVMSSTQDTTCWSPWPLDEMLANDTGEIHGPPPRGHRSRVGPLMKYWEGPGRVTLRALVLRGPHFPVTSRTHSGN